MSGPAPTITRSPAETRALGRELATRLAPGEVVALIGDLGSGKTCLAQGICEGLGVPDPVTSPTFILINEYQGRRGTRVLPVYHLDLYRLAGPGELEDLGIEEYYYGEGICLVEWADRAAAQLPARHWEIRLEQVGTEERRITVSRSVP
ncbi:MAG: tRNA (adenosine(37)-N6)-threonylcarbamoyltransferase complex ATPase subunit type 1 TsaE [Candidatus Latescibacterota bacterium]|jgi:tRNA threonylcarbamoyladenosine biosynthesis protein TsaE